MKGKRGSGSIALALRVRDEWTLTVGLLEHLAGVIDEAWILDDASVNPPPVGDLLTAFPATRVLSAERWSGTDGKLGEGEQRDRLLQCMKRKSRCLWVLQIDADERLTDPDGLPMLTSVDHVDAWVLPLVDFYIAPDDARSTDAYHPQRVREWFGPEVRWTLSLFKLLPQVYVSRGDVREPQGFRPRRVRRTCALIEHYGKSISSAEWDRKARFYIDNYPEYRDKWAARLGRAVHDGFSDFGAPLLRRDTGGFNPEAATEIWSYVPDFGLRAVAKRLVYGRLGLVANRLRLRTGRQ